MNRSLNRILSALYLILMMDLLSCCEKRVLSENSVEEVSHERLIGSWKLVKQIKINDATRSEMVTDYSNVACPSIVNISTDTLTQFDIISTINLPITPNCYFKISSHYSFRPHIGLIQEVDTLVVSLGYDTLFLSQNVIVRGQGPSTQVSVYTYFTGQLPPAGTACDCGDSIFYSHSQ